MLCWTKHNAIFIANQIKSMFGQIHPYNVNDKTKITHALVVLMDYTIYFFVNSNKIYNTDFYNSNSKITNPLQM